MADVHAAAFPEEPFLSLHPVVKDMRAAAKKLRVSTLPPKIQPYFSVWTIFANILRGRSSIECTPVEVRSRLAVLLALDIGSRGQELSLVVRHKLVVTTKGMQGYLWNTKEQTHPALILFQVKHCHKRFDDRICTPCVAMRYLHLFPTDKCAELCVISEGKQSLMTSNLFVTQKSVSQSAQFHPLGKDRCSKLVHQEMTDAGIDTGVWRAHDIRGASSSKCFNLGLELNRVKMRLRHSLRSDTFLQNYHRPGNFVKNKRNAGVDWELLVRHKE